MLTILLSLMMAVNIGTKKANLPKSAIFEDFDPRIEVYSYQDSGTSSNYVMLYDGIVRKVTHTTDTIVDPLGYGVKFIFEEISKQFSKMKMVESLKDCDSISFHSCLENKLGSWKRMFESKDRIVFVEIIPLSSKDEFVIYVAIEDQKYRGLLGY